jgi:hypothetical protein
MRAPDGETGKSTSGAAIRGGATGTAEQGRKALEPGQGGAGAVTLTTLVLPPGR